MTKPYCNPISSLDQGETTPTVYHYNKRIDDPDFDFEDSFCRRLNKIQGIADLFHRMGESGERQLTSTGCFGISSTLEDAAKDLRNICYEMLKWERSA